MLKPTFPYTDHPRPSLPLLWCPWPPHGQNGMWSHLFRMQLLSSVMLGCLLSAGRPECIWEPLNGAVSAEAGRWAWEEAACCTHTYTPSSLQRLLDPPCRDGQVNQNEKGTGTETGTGKPQNAMKDWKTERAVGYLIKILIPPMSHAYSYKLWSSAKMVLWIIQAS